MWTLNVMSATSSLFNVKIHRDSRYLVLRRDDSPHVTIKDVPDLILAPDDTPRVPRQHVNTAFEPLLLIVGDAPMDRRRCLVGPVRLIEVNLRWPLVVVGPQQFYLIGTRTVDA